MTKDKEKLINNNIKLIYWFMKKYKLSDDDTIDWYGTCAIGLCRAAEAYDPDKGIKFSTFAVHCMYNEYIREVSRKRVQAVALDDKIWDAYIKDERDDISTWEERWDIRDLYEKELKRLPLKKQTIIRDIIEKDFKLREVAQKHNVSRQYISSVYKDFVEKLRKVVIEN